MWNNITNFNTTILVSSLAQHQVWGFLPTLSLIVLLTSVPANAAVLFLFFKDDQLQTPFNVYLINLFASNILAMLSSMPLYLINNLRGYWWTGHASCTLYVYSYIIQAGMCNSHALITINRLWAVLRPISYRRYHTKKFALILCIIMWVSVHVFKLAILIPDALYYRLPEEKYGCFINKAPQLGWAITQQFLVHVGPAVVVIVCYPIICYRQWIRVKVTLRVLPVVRAASSQGSLVPKGSSNRTTRPAQRVETPPVIEVHRQHLRAVVKKKSSFGFLVLTLATLSVLVFWMPSLLFFTAGLFRTVTWPYIQNVAAVMWFLETAVDPVMFTLALRDLRRALVRTFKCC